MDDDVSKHAIGQAARLGIDLFDTADVYGFGHSERVLADGLGAKRGGVAIISKFGVAWDDRGVRGKDLSPGYAARALDASLARLNVATIPVYLMHWPDERTPIRTTMQFLSEAQKAGKVAAIGCSNFSVMQLEEALRYGPLDVVEVPFNVLRAEEAMPILRWAERAGVSVIAFDVLGKGLLTGKLGLAPIFAPEDIRSRDPELQGSRLQRNLKLVEQVRALGSRYGKTPAQVAIRWVLDHPLVTCAMVGMRSPAQVDENLGALGWRLDLEDFDRLAALASA